MMRLFDFAGSQAAWWWCVLFVRAERAWLALAGPLAYIAVHFVVRAGWRAAIGLLALAAASIGLLADSALVRAGVLHFPHDAKFMIALWAAFGVSLTASMRFLRERPAYVAFAFGALAGPIAYAGGARLGVLELEAHGWVAVAAAWALAIGALSAVARVVPRGAS